MAKAALFGHFRLYPRGFLGSLQTPTLVVSTKKGDVLTASGLSSLLDTNESSTITANAAIEDLFTRLMHRHLLLSSFDFSTEVYREFFKALGTPDFEGWYMAQFQSPAFGELHRDFLDDCLRFMMTGKRSIQLNTWEALIDVNDEKIKSTDLSEQARSYFGKSTIRELSPSGKHLAIDTVQSWISHPGGTHDLLHSAHILFGLMRQ